MPFSELQNSCGYVEKDGTFLFFYVDCLLEKPRVQLIWYLILN